MGLGASAGIYTSSSMSRCHYKFNCNTALSRVKHLDRQEQKQQAYLPTESWQYAWRKKFPRLKIRAISDQTKLQSIKADKSK